jgi:hypothetical protein
MSLESEELESPIPRLPSPQVGVEERVESSESEPGEEDYIDGDEGALLKGGERKRKSVHAESSKPKRRRMNAMDKTNAILDGQHRIQLELTVMTLKARAEREKIRQNTALRIRRLEIEAEDRRHREDRAHERWMLMTRLEFERAMAREGKYRLRRSMDDSENSWRISSISSTSSPSPAIGHGRDFNGTSTGDELDSAIRSTIGGNL